MPANRSPRWPTSRTPCLHGASTRRLLPRSRLSDYREAESASGVGWNYLAANGFANDRDHTIYRYKNANEYVQAVNDYAAVPAADPATFAGYYRWDVYYSTACDVLLPVGYAATSPIPLATIWRPVPTSRPGRA